MQVNARANWFVTVGLDLTSAIFTDGDTIGGKKLSDILSVTGSISYFIDFGKIGQVLLDTMNNLRSGNSSTGTSLISGLLNSGAEIGLVIQASVGIKLNDLTKGFLPDISLGSASINVLATLGNGNSKMARGFYFNFSTSFDGLQNLYSFITDKFGTIFSDLGVTLPTFQLGIQSNIAIAVQDTAFGFSLNLLNGLLNLVCVLKYSPLNFSCNALNLKAFFNIVSNAGNWVITQASSFFDNTGKTLAQFAQTTGEFFNSTGNDIKNAFTNFGNSVATWGQNTLNSITSLGWKRRRFLKKLRRLRRLRKLRRQRKLMKLKKRFN